MQRIETTPTAAHAPDTARLPTADSRLGAWLFAGGENHNRLYLSRMKEAGIERVVYRLAYPTLTDFDPTLAKNRAFYRWLSSQIRNFGMNSVVVVSPQFRDENFFRGQPLGEQCSEKHDTAGAISDQLVEIVEHLEPEMIVLDLKPSTIARSPGCADQASNIDATRFLQSVLDRAEPGLRAQLAVSVDLTSNAAYRDFVVSHPEVAIISVSTLDFLDPDPTRFVELWENTAKQIHDAGKRVVSDAFWMRKPVRLGECPGQPVALSDLADLWRTVDEAIIARSVDDGEFVAIYETDLVFGGYLSADQFHCGEGLVLKNRRLSQLSSRMARRYRAPSETGGD
ncbi:MAG: hypothetical protein AAFN07_06840 [Pseudomonadota bacterium]